MAWNYLVDAELAHWTRKETDSCAALIRGALLRDCDCWQRWEDIHIETPALALEHCETRHVLKTWNPDRQSLDDFLFHAALQGQLRLADPAKGLGEVTMINDFRRGMLAKVLVDAQLVAGPVLRCSEDGCHGEISYD